MADSRMLDAIVPLVEQLGSAYLSTPIRESMTTCRVCLTASPGQEMCDPCQRQYFTFGDRLADQTAFVIYARAAHQTGRIMYGYKESAPAEEHVRMVQLLFASALLGHRDCPARLAGVEVTHWCVVPSLKGRAGPHPVESAVWPFLSQSLSKITLQVQTTQEPRRVRVDRFASDVELGAGAHVLVLDDTWTTGGHAQSAALSVRAAGAGVISVLVLARWLDPNWDATKHLIEKRLNKTPPDLRVCPWTGGACPD